VGEERGRGGELRWGRGKGRPEGQAVVLRQSKKFPNKNLHFLVVSKRRGEGGGGGGAEYP
jgi:hypothetical protein